MSKNRYNLIYDHVFELDNVYFIIDNGNFLIIDNSGNIDDSYDIGCEVVKDLFVLYRENKTCVVVDREMNVLTDCYRGDLLMWLAKRFDNLSYTELKQVVGVTSTGLTVDKSNELMDSLNFKKAYRYFMMIEVEFRDKPNSNNIETLSISINAHSLNSTFMNGKRVESFLKCVNKL